MSDRPHLPTWAKKTALLLLKLTVSGSLMYLLLRQAGIEKVLSLLVGIDPFMFMLAVLIFLFVQLIASIRWGLLLLPEKFGVRRLYPLYLLGAFFNVFLPGLVGGDAVKTYYLYKQTGKGMQALSSVFLDRYIGLFSLMVVGLVAFPFGFKSLRGSGIEWYLPLIVLAFISISFTFIGLRLGSRFKFLSDIYGYIHSYRKLKHILAKAFFLSFMGHLCSIGSVYFIAIGLGERVPYFVLLIFIPIIATLSAVPLSISGLGIREVSTVLLLGAVGVEPDKAIAISLAWFLSIAVGGLAGLYEYLRTKNWAKGEA